MGNRQEAIVELVLSRSEFDALYDLVDDRVWTLEKDIHNDGGHWLWRTEEERNDRIDELKYLQRVFRQLERYL